MSDDERRRQGAAAIIPAYNEAGTVAEVIEVALAADEVDEVIVVDNASDDDTAGVAERAGARVVACPQQGKGQAMATGVEATDAEIICFLDADLLNLTTEHIDRLIRAVRTGRVGMSLGLFDRGPELNPIFLHMLPRLTGQRAMRRELFESLDARDISGYRVEAALNSRADELGLEIEAFVCDGLWHRTKEEKDEDGAVYGTLRKIRMLLTAVYSYGAYQTLRPIRQRREALEDAFRERRDQLEELARQLREELSAAALGDVDGGAPPGDPVDTSTPAGAAASVSAPETEPGGHDTKDGQTPNRTG